MSDPNQLPGIRIWTICGGLLIILSVAYFCFAQTAPSPIAPLRDGWAAIDERFVFLTVELSSVETSLNAVNNALVAAGREQSKAQQRAENYAAGNNRMDRQGGGPMDWQDFYGKTAASFYYHSSGSSDVQGQSNFQLHAQQQGNDTKAIDRPPQFDYIYRANSDAEKRAETDAASMGNKIDQLLARRRELESEQSSLWCKIALRGLSSRNLSVKAMYRYDLPASPPDKQSTQRFAAISACCKFMRTINVLVKQAQPALDGDQSPVFTQLQHAVDSAREDLDSSLLDLPILADALTDSQSYIGQFDAAVRRLDDLSQNLVDSYRLAGDGDRADDDQRKNRFRGQFQQNIMDFASTVLTADEALTTQAAEWKITPDASRPVTTDPNAKPVIVPTTLPSPPPGVDFKPSAQPPEALPNNPSDVKAINGPDVKAISAARDDIATAETRLLDGTPFTSDQELSQVDKPYEIKDVYCPAPNSKSLKILVRPGVEVRGGRINLEPGGPQGQDAQLLLIGTNSKPIILRHVEIDQPWTGVFNATHVIFDQCTFQKSGAWYSLGGYSSRWPMDQCLLYRCKFGSFNAVDYGFKLTNCTFVEMDFPEIEHARDPAKKYDLMDWLRKDGNIIRSCSFVDCTIFPTVFWCSESSNFWNCTFLPGTAFESDTPTRVVAFVYGTTGDTPDKINQNNPPVRAPMVIKLRNAPFSALRWAADCPIPELRLDDRYAGIVFDRADNR
jgi:hypothetical protein